MESTIESSLTDLVGGELGSLNGHNSRTRLASSFGRLSRSASAFTNHTGSSGSSLSPKLLRRRHRVSEREPHDHDNDHEDAMPAKRVKVSQESQQNQQQEDQHHNHPQILSDGLQADTPLPKVHLSSEALAILESERQWLSSDAVMFVLGLFTACCPASRLADSLWISPTTPIADESVKACFLTQGTGLTGGSSNGGEGQNDHDQHHHSRDAGQIQILFPLNISNTHWLLALSNGDGHSFTYLDSMKDRSNAGESHAVVSSARRFARNWCQRAEDVNAQDEGGEHSKPHVNGHHWLAPSTQQEPGDSFNCGIFITVFALRLLQTHCLKKSNTTAKKYTPESPIACPLLWRRLFALVSRLSNNDNDNESNDDIATPITSLLSLEQVTVNKALPPFQQAALQPSEGSSYEENIAAYLRIINSNVETARKVYSSRQQTNTQLISTIEEMVGLFAWAENSASVELARLVGGPGGVGDDINMGDGGSKGVLASMRNELRQVKEARLCMATFTWTHVSPVSIMAEMDSTIKLLAGKWRFWQRRASYLTAVMKLIGPVSGVLSRDLKRLQEIERSYADLAGQVDGWGKEERGRNAV